MLAEVAERLHTELILPDHYYVANAVGAIAGSVMVSEEILVYPHLSPSGLDVIGYYVQARDNREEYEELEDALKYARERATFGKAIIEFQNTQFKLAELATEVEVGQAFVDKLLAAHVAGQDIVAGVSMAKWWTTELQKRLTSECLQLHGGYGFMSEYPISGDYQDAAVQSIYAGTNEIMKRIIARRMGLG